MGDVKYFKVKLNNPASLMEENAIVRRESRRKTINRHKSTAVIKVELVEPAEEVLRNISVVNEQGTSSTSPHPPSTIAQQVPIKFVTTSVLNVPLNYNESPSTATTTSDVASSSSTTASLLSTGPLVNPAISSMKKNTEYSSSNLNLYDPAMVISEQPTSSKIIATSDKSVQEGSGGLSLMVVESVSSINQPTTSSHSSNSDNTGSDSCTDGGLVINVVCKRPTLKITTPGVKHVSDIDQEIMTPRGTLTRFNIPVPESDISKLVPTKRVEKLRGLSLSNATNPDNFEEWVSLASPLSTMAPQLLLPLVSEEAEDEFKKGEEYPTRDVTNIDIINASSPACTRVGDQKLPAAISHVLSSPIPSPQKQPLSTTTATTLFTWSAIFIGTDKEYLEQSSFRKLFRENALQKTDVQLFFLPEVKKEELSEAQVANLDRKKKCNIQ